MSLPATATSRPRRVGRRAALIAGVAAVLALTALVSFSLGAATPPGIVGGWAIGPARTCADLGLEAERCEDLRQRALSYAEETGGPVLSATMHETRRVADDGTSQLYDSGGGMPDAVLLVRRRDGSWHVALMGCFQPRGAGSPTDPSCP